MPKATQLARDRTGIQKPRTLEPLALLCQVWWSPSRGLGQNPGRVGVLTAMSTYKVGKSGTEPLRDEGQAGRPRAQCQVRGLGRSSEYPTAQPLKLGAWGPGILGPICQLQDGPLLVDTDEWAQSG